MRTARQQTTIDVNRGWAKQLRQAAHEFDDVANMLEQEFPLVADRWAALPAGSLVLDLYEGQGDPDWPLVPKAGVRGVIAKAYQFREDHWFAENWQGIKAAGLPRGAYCFADFDREPEDQANAFLDVVDDAGGLDDDDLIVLDAEDAYDDAGHVIPRGDMGPWMERWLRTADTRKSRDAWVYTGRYWALVHGAVANAYAAGHPLWLAAYQDAQPSTIPGWTGAFRLWQYTSAGGLPGINADVDLCLTV